MTFRMLDKNHDWIFGAGAASYLTENEEIALNIKTRLLSFLNDCFFALDEGIDWWNLLDYHSQDKLQAQINEVIVKTPGVTKINSIDISFGANRKMRVEYSIDTVFSKNHKDTVELLNA